MGDANNPKAHAIGFPVFLALSEVRVPESPIKKRVQGKAWPPEMALMRV